MALAEWYPIIKPAHIGLAGSSVALFAARGAGVPVGAAWPMSRGVRRLSVAIDVALLAAGGALWALLSLNPARDTWLGTKLALIVLYIVLGSFALKRARSRTARAASFAAALACIATVAAIAWTHDPLAPWRLLAGSPPP
jgi:uncharacterized membrane protein SirB2